MKTQLMKRAAALVPGGSPDPVRQRRRPVRRQGEGPAGRRGAPRPRTLEIRTYRGIPYQAQFLAAGGEGEDLTFAVEEEPRKGHRPD